MFGSCWFTLLLLMAGRQIYKCASPPERKADPALKGFFTAASTTHSNPLDILTLSL
ncbi:hypothetical protein BDW60DRAFT_196989 [Aspergillus nidulans var. acristatus]